MEDKKEQKNTAEPVSAIEQWREALQKMPEWDSLPDDFHENILIRLKTTQFPAEPSGHTSWKHVKETLKRGEQPDWVDLITATFIWRVKQRRAGKPQTTALPGSFVSGAAYPKPPIHITNWPTKGATAAWEPKKELIPQNDVKSEESVPSSPMPALWVPKTPAAREPTVPREATAANEPSAPLTTRPMAPTTSGVTGSKRPRTADQEDTTIQSKKRQNTTTTTKDEPAAGTNDLVDWREKLAHSEDKVTDLIKELAEIKEELADTVRKLADTSKDLENTTMELGELRVIAMGNRRYIRRIVGGLAAGAHSAEQLTNQVRQKYEALAETIG
ncbi:hypothetical protein BR93DRAFT_996760 [Coniochaeta sp. PMI_546]|nr:hypothetical protein BR93DRAFT_996760 [Coniochaeta sp. PMI_546]